MKTIQQALVDEIHYPISIGFVENVMIKRNLKERILLRVNSIYKTIGEPLVELEAKPTVYVGDCLL